MRDEKNSNSIDFVLTWVDGADSSWRKRYAEHKGVAISDDVRYRDMGMLKYWFRLVEINAPWVRKIFFVTEGHLPEWLNVEHPKLVHVRHEDYIPEEYLPVFSSHPIEIHLHRIKGLSERFVYFNDDMFILKKTDSSVFFDKNGLPRDAAVMNAISGDELAHVVINDVHMVNRYFSKKSVLRKNLIKWFNPKYGTGLFRNILLYPWPNFTGFFDYHLPAPYLKKTFTKVWDLLGDNLILTSSSKFRSSSDLNQYIFRYWQLVEGEFSPISRHKVGFYAEISSDSSRLRDLIIGGKYNMCCINDSSAVNFELVKEEIHSIFESLVPAKSSFEI